MLDLPSTRSFVIHAIFVNESRYTHQPQQATTANSTEAMVKTMTCHQARHDFTRNKGRRVKPHAIGMPEACPWHGTWRQEVNETIGLTQRARSCNLAALASESCQPVTMVCIPIKYKASLKAQCKGPKAIQCRKCKPQGPV